MRMNSLLITANSWTQIIQQRRTAFQARKGKKRQLAQTLLLWIINPMSAQEILLEEIKHQPEPVLREVLNYLKFLERQRGLEGSMEGVIADNWEKLGPPPDVDYDKL